ncbi:MAG TPA: ATP-binding protein [Ignavibacteria bacterium]|nr:ATP-binding protein [Ignavibacteria bacterium]
MKNPFVFGKIVGKKNFCNRKEEIEYLLRNIENGFSIWLFAPRRYGKSSLIKQVFNNTPNNIKTIYFDLYNVQSIDDFSRKYSNTIAKELFNWKEDVKKISKKLGKYLLRLQPQLNFDVNANPSISFANREITDQVDIEEVLNLPQKIAEEHDTKICVAFDEFQEISRIDKFFINWMRSAFQNQKNISYVFLGNKQSLMENIFSSINSPFYEYAVKMDIQPIERRELFEFIKNKFAEQNLSINAETIDCILDNSNCHPHFTQYFASVVFDEIRNGSDENDEKFNHKWMEKIIDSQSVIFQNIYDQLNNNQRKILLTLSHSNREIFSSAIRKKYNLPISSTLSTNIKSLIQKDLIYKDSNLYKISNPILDNWLKTLS